MVKLELDDEVQLLGLVTLVTLVTLFTDDWLKSSVKLRPTGLRRRPPTVFYSWHLT